MSAHTLPLIFALKHLHVCWHDENLSCPKVFSRDARLMQGTREIPAADDAEVEMLLGENLSGSLPQGVELQMLTMECDGWPEDVAFSFAGISAFGAKDVARAKVCAKHVLTLNRDCTLARQLVKLIAASVEVRCPFGVDAGDAPDVVGILTAQS